MHTVQIPLYASFVLIPSPKHVQEPRFGFVDENVGGHTIEQGLFLKEESFVLFREAKTDPTTVQTSIRRQTG